MHTIYVVMLGFILLAVFLLAGHAFGTDDKQHCAFCRHGWPGPLINLWFGVSKAGYSVRDEAPIFLLVFAVPSALALLAWWKLPVR